MLCKLWACNWCAIAICFLLVFLSRYCSWRIFLTVSLQYLMLPKKNTSIQKTFLQILMKPRLEQMCTYCRDCCLALFGFMLATCWLNNYVSSSVFFVDGHAAPCNTENTMASKRWTERTGRLKIPDNWEPWTELIAGFNQRILVENVCQTWRYQNTNLPVILFWSFLLFGSLQFPSPQLIIRNQTFL